MILNTLCPACRKKAFGLMVKAMLGPARAVACPHCGESIGLSVWPHLAGVAAVVGYVIVSATADSPMASGRIAAAVLASMVLLWGLWFLQSPLVRKKGI